MQILTAVDISEEVEEKNVAQVKKKSVKRQKVGRSFVCQKAADMPVEPAVRPKERKVKGSDGGSE